LTKTDELTAGQGMNDNMQTSGGMLDMLKRREALVLTRYALGDGGYTWGYGHFSTNPDALPVTITRPFAEQLFADDVVARAEKWVKLYVTADLSQNEFDALVSIAYNMRPQSFKKFADSVNRGDGIDGIAAESVGWVAAKFTNGIANRRAAEMAVFNEGIYS
jgi:lysozyme